MNDLSDNSVNPSSNQGYRLIAPAPNGKDNDDDDDDDVNKRIKRYFDKKRLESNKREQAYRRARKYKKYEMDRCLFFTDKHKEIIDLEKSKLTRFFNQEKEINSYLDYEKFIRYSFDSFR
uniref:hypothetical protein n=1 Tax=Aspergillus affinis TaxID=1070780 RepID=UPI002551E7DE|nr:hypothetical protein QQP14_mgp15 [Aspergillus affinis]UPW99831.1 hypothetical protein [Aspergillus affinis]